jgi:hypothetical protein
MHCQWHLWRVALGLSQSDFAIENCPASAALFHGRAIRSPEFTKGLTGDK